jgi:hypothetical protein
MQSIGVLFKNGGRRPPYGHLLPKGRREKERLVHRPMTQKIKTFLMFDGDCEQAMNF